MLTYTPLNARRALFLATITACICNDPASSLLSRSPVIGLGAIHPLLLTIRSPGSIDRDCRRDIGSSNCSTLSFKSSSEDDFKKESQEEEEEEKSPPKEQPPVLPPRVTMRRRGRLRNIPYVANPYNIPRDPEQRWEFFYKLLVFFFIENGHTNVESGPQVNQSLLRNWMAEQRRSYMKTLNILTSEDNADNKTPPLSNKKKERLDRAGFHWGQFGDIDMQECAENNLKLALDPSFTHKKDLDWIQMAQKLRDYKKEYGDCDVPLDFAQNPKLGKWVSKQRRLREIMPKRRRATLDLLEFDWFIDTTQANNSNTTKVLWSEMLERLIRFRRDNGHCDVPSHYHEMLELGQWVTKQRKAYKSWKAGKKAPMNEKRVLVLEKLGFNWTL